MRLIDVETHRLRTFVGKNTPPYAILSHTWGPDAEEVSFQDITTGNFESRGNGTRKLKGCCLQAKRDGFKYAWIDTCCINKDSSTELGEAINSMFRWYHKAAVCYAYLADVGPADDHRDTSSSFFTSRWFRRGWTLQELLAPEVLQFYNSEWGLIGTKEDYSHEIEVITGIPRQFLLGWDDFRQASVAQRMSWVATRETTRTEDMAYCLLGIFDITMPMIYGEGTRSLRRLQQEIIRVSRDHSILAWGLGLAATETANQPTDTVSGGALTTTPAEFARCGNVVPKKVDAVTAIDLELVAGGCLSVQISLHTAPTGDLYGLLSCGPENNPTQVVGIPLHNVATGTESDEYFRPRNRRPILMDMPASARDVRPIRLQMEHASRAPRTVNQRCWLFFDGHKKIGLELDSVWPQVRWEKGRVLISEATNTDKGVPRYCLAKFCAKSKEVRDLVVVLELTAERAQQPRPHAMALSRLESVTLKTLSATMMYMNGKVFGQQTVSIGNLHVRVAVETRMVAQEPVFVMRLSQGSSPPENAMDAEIEFQHASNKLQLIQVLLRQDKARLNVEKLHEKSGKKSAALGQMTDQLTQIQQRLEKLREEQKGVTKARDTLQKEWEQAEPGLLEAQRTLDLCLGAASDLQDSVEKVESKGNPDGWLDELIRNHLAFGDFMLGPADGELFGIDTNDEDERKRMSPLSWAAINGAEAIARLLLDKGADVDAKIAGGWTPLLLAAYKGHHGIVKSLLDKGADTQARNDKGATALQCAYDQRHDAIAELLKEKCGAPPVPATPGNKDTTGPRPRASRMHDLEFAAEIGTSLISQVRNLQALLAEREAELQYSKDESSRLEIQLEHLHQRLRVLDESETRYKDENWNLETQIHEMQQALRDERQKLKTALEARSRDVLVQGADLAVMRRKVEELMNQNQELAKALSMYNDRMASGSVTNETSVTGTGSDSSTNEQSPPSSPEKGPLRHSALESETLKSSLSHAQRTIQSLRTNIHREKTEKLELKRMLQEARDELERARSPGLPADG
ncbi:hypothetical protein B0T16DRAFT_409230 [Cercophora newfieldiana]|uniref:Heterokaryon incompatibility domain-containing protein n=1 Tax=Cercophora newfieldiana TaxID=92897 RepID=A0AA39YAE3_9PEZI|nr:hypothetical protein B0T16DRAFT_409230 [Cercophora newfieldiana]